MLQYSFKYVANSDDLASLNEGNFGLSQVGKFVTIYPSSSIHLEEIVSDLTSRLPSTHSPRVPFDYQLASHTNVFLRYGAFNYLPIREPIGAIAPAWVDERGDAIPDSRTSACPDDALLQLKNHGIDVLAKCNPPLLQKRYVATDLLHHGPRGSIFLGVDTEKLSQVIIKSAHRLDRISERDGRSSYDRLKHEYRALSNAFELGISPQPYLCEEQDDSAFLVMEYLEGTSLQSHIQKRLLSCQEPDLHFARSTFDKLVEINEALRKIGIHHGDLSPRNIILSPQGMKIIDFEHVVFSDDLASGVWASGTPGFSMKPKFVTSQTELDERCRYSLESIFYFLATGKDGLGSFRNASEAIKWVRNLSKLPQNDTERVSLLTSSKGMAVTEATHHFRSDGTSLYDGLSGKIFAYQYLNCTSQTHEPTSNAVKLVKKLRETPLHPGFYVGGLGVAHILRHFLGSPDEAEVVEKEAFNIPNASPDFLNGRAGQLRYFCTKYLAAKDTEDLLTAKQLAERLCEEYSHNEAGWKIPQGYGDLSNKTHVGYAHGAAGIVDCLIDYYRISRCSKCLEIIRHFESSLASRFEIRSEMWTWPEGGRDGGGASWCHGAVGIGRFYLGYSCLDQNRASLIAEAISKYLFENARWQGVHYCHGLAGTIDFLVDTAKIFRSSTNIRRAASLSNDAMALMRSAELPSDSLFTGELGLALVTAKQKYGLSADLLRMK
ncbi:MAG: hypothetical protein OIF40_09915 [Mangrovicoccus sp.]|nr:hypothetical protein [Mangrovicoccus sp.]